MSLKIESVSSRQLLNEETLAVIRSITQGKNTINAIAAANNVPVDELINHQYRFYRGEYDRLQGDATRRELEMAEEIKSLQARIYSFEEMLKVLIATRCNEFWCSNVE